MVVAGTVGFTARRFGRSARDLDPEHRRDGVGLLWLAIAHRARGQHLVADGQPGRPVHLGVRARRRRVRGLADARAGRRCCPGGTCAIPTVTRETGRVVIGWAALTIGVLGLVHIANGTPAPSDGAVAMRHAGGLIGFAASAPLAKVLTAWVAAPILALIAGFGILVISGTPVHRIPERMEEARVFFGRRTRVLGDEEDYSEEFGEDGEEGGELEGGGRRIRGQLARAARGAVAPGRRSRAATGSSRTTRRCWTPDKRPRRGTLEDPAAGLGEARPGALRPGGRRPARKPTRGCSKRSVSCRGQPPAITPASPQP